MARFSRALAFASVLIVACSSKTSSSSGGDACQSGDVISRPCGNCGSATRACSAGSWGEWSACTGEGECQAGATDSTSCGSSVGACRPGTMTRTCSSTCSWGVFSACAGGVAPSAEACGNGVDENCNGTADEGCTCHPVAPGAGSSFAVTGKISKMVADPHRCFVYALATGSPSEVVVIDVDQKRERTRIALPQQATDFAISPDGTRMVVAHDLVHQISDVDLGTLVVRTLPVTSDPYAIAVDDAGTVYYAEVDQWSDLRRVALGTGGDTLLASWGAYQPDLELSADGRSLYSGESGISGGELVRYDVSGATAVVSDRSTWDDGYGFPYPARHVYLSPGGQHVYYAGYELDATRLSLVLGATGEEILAEDVAGTFAIGARHVHDARLVKPVADLPEQVSAAALASADAELWTYSADTGKVSYRNMADLVDLAALGDRFLAPEPLAAYHFGALVADPVRPRLYGLDRDRELVVAIDAATLAPLGAILVGSGPWDLDVSPTGDALYVGHLAMLAVARIDLTTFAFDRMIPTPRVNADIEVLTPTRLATIDGDQWTTPTLVDLSTGEVLDSVSWGAYMGALSATADGRTLFVGESGISGGDLVRYDVSGGTFAQVAKSTYDHGYGFPYPSRSVVALPDGSGVFYARYLLDGADLGVLRYAQADTILTVTPDGRLATSSTQVYRVSDGGALGALSTPGSVQAMSPDGKTLYVVTGGAIAMVDLTAFEAPGAAAAGAVSASR